MKKLINQPNWENAELIRKAHCSQWRTQDLAKGGRGHNRRSGGESLSRRRLRRSGGVSPSCQRICRVFTTKTQILACFLPKKDIPVPEVTINYACRCVLQYNVQ